MINKNNDNNNSEQEESDFINYYVNEDKKIKEADEFPFPSYNFSSQKSNDDNSDNSNPDLSNTINKDNEPLKTKEVQEKTQETNNIIEITKPEINLINKLLRNIKQNTDQIAVILSTNQINENSNESDSQIVKGVFDGEKMISQNGKEYSIAANYASKSKLVEGDTLKLTILPSGAFVYKQIKPIERKTIIGKLQINSNNDYAAVSPEGQEWRILKASVTYYRGEPGDEIIFFIPEQKESKWAAVDNIIKTQK